MRLRGPFISYFTKNRQDVFELQRLLAFRNVVFDLQRETANRTAFFSDRKSFRQHEVHTFAAHIHLITVTRIGLCRYLKKRAVVRNQTLDDSQRYIAFDQEIHCHFAARGYRHRVSLLTIALEFIRKDCAVRRPGRSCQDGKSQTQADTPGNY